MIVYEFLTFAAVHNVERAALQSSVTRIVGMTVYVVAGKPPAKEATTSIAELTEQEVDFTPRTSTSQFVPNASSKVPTKVSVSLAAFRPADVKVGVFAVLGV